MKKPTPHFASRKTPYVVTYLLCGVVMAMMDSKRPLSLTPQGIVSAAAAVVLSLVPLACSGGNSEIAGHPIGQDDDLALSSQPNASGEVPNLRCAEGDVRICSFYLPEHNGVRPCIVGYQVCEEEQWNRCTEGLPADGGAPE